MYNSFGLFFSGTRAAGGGGWRQSRFFVRASGSALPPIGGCAAEGLAYKKCDRKKQQKGGRGEGQKRPSKPAIRRVGIFCPVGLRVFILSGGIGLQLF